MYCDPSASKGGPPADRKGPGDSPTNVCGFEPMQLPHRPALPELNTQAYRVPDRRTYRGQPWRGERAPWPNT
eukprot:327719-Alexandrium_andersonii.AAC.1